MKNLNNILFYLFILYLPYVWSFGKNLYEEIDGDCRIESAGDGVDSFLININDTNPEGIVASYQGINFIEQINVWYPETQMTKYFNINYQQETKEIILKLESLFATDYERNENLSQVTIVAEFTCESENSKNMSFILNITDTNNFDPQFTPNPPYVYTILLPAGEGTPITPLYGEFGSRDNDLTTYGIDFGIEENPYFNISTHRQSNHKKVIYYASIIAKKSIMELKENFVFNISATDMDLTGEERRTVYAQVTIIPDQALIFPQTPIFSESFYEGTLKAKDIQLDSIKFPDHYDETVQFSLSGEMSTYFKIETNQDNISIKLDETTPDGVLMETNYFIFALEATNEYNLRGSTVIFLENIKELLGGVNLKPVYFSSYHFVNNTIYPYEIFEMSCDFRYTLQDYTDNFKVECINNQIQLQIVNDLPKTADDFIAMELIVEDNISTVYTMIVLNLILTELQLDPMVIINIDEEREYTSLLAIADVDCTYNEITSIWPEDAIDWFDFDTENRVLSCKKIDREHHTIAYMNVSQIQLELSVRCHYFTNQPNMFNKKRNTILSEHSRDTTDYERHWIYTKNMDYTQNVQLLNIIVNDINDNAPVFENENPLYLGYPTYTLAQHLKPQNLVTVKANDADIGINAEIKYTTNSQNFTIHSTTGEIYPVGNLFLSDLDEEISFIVSAIDENGQGAHQTDINIQVKPLKEENIAIISINDLAVEDTFNILEEISNKTLCKLILLSSTILLGDEISDSKELKGHKVDGISITSLVLFVYALDENNEIMDGSNITRLINEEDGGSLSATLFMSTRTVQDSVTGSLIAAVTVLAILLSVAFILMIIFFIGFKRYRRMRNYRKDSNNSSQSQIIEAMNNNNSRSTNSSNSMVLYDLNR